MQEMRKIQSQARLMGSPFSIQAYVPMEMDRSFAESLIQLAFGEVMRIEDELTDFRSSPFNRINECAGVCPVRVSKEIFEIVDMSLRISKDSDGAFDISYASVGHLWREAQNLGYPPSSEALEEAKSFVDYKKIQVNWSDQTIFLPHPKMRIGLGGIGKGYAVDQAYDFLRRCGFENLCVNGAGDIRVHSASDAPRPWRIGVRNPLAQRDVAMGLVAVAQGAIATSGDYERFFRYKGEKYHHVFDGRTGQLTEEVVSVTVLAPTATLSDILATTAMALGPDEGIRFLNRLGNVTGFLVTRTGEVMKCKSWSH